MTMKSETVDHVPLSKTALAHYFRNYEEFLGPLREQPLDMLELGVAYGDSLKYWESWLPNARITGLDTKPCPVEFTSGRVATYVGEQQDRALLDRIGRERAPGGFDIIIDDAAHVGQLARICFWHLFENHLKPGGLYFIEDWGTGYWPQYPDGKHYHPAPIDFAWHEKLLNAARDMALVRNIMPLRKAVGWSRWNLVKARHKSHDYGMVGFVKSLIDECGVQDATHDSFGTGTPRTSRFKWMRVSLGHVVICKEW